MSASTFAFALGATVSLADVIYTAEFYNHADTKLGTFSFNQGRISIELISNEGIPESCYGDTGYQWHLHGNNQLGNGTHGFGVNECGKPQAGGHYDPTLACSALSDAAATCTCLNRQSPYECVHSGNPYTCELGDFSNKHEGGWIGAETMGLTIGTMNFEDHYLDINLDGKSIVFHCGDQQVQFCASLIKSETQTNTPRVSKPTSDPSSLIADFGVGAVIINDINMELEMEADLLADLAANITGGSSCYSSGFSYHIHDKWEHTAGAGVGAECGSAFTGGHYDPTAACGPASGNPDCATACLDSSVYNCDFAENPYTCEVGDLSGKYGQMATDGSSTVSADFLPGLHLLDGKSIVLHCGDGSRAVCAKLTPGSQRLAQVEYVSGVKVGRPSTPAPTFPDCSVVNCNPLDASVRLKGSVTFVLMGALLFLM